jgi:hypothetical protein
VRGNRRAVGARGVATFVAHNLNGLLQRGDAMRPHGASALHAANSNIHEFGGPRLGDGGIAVRLSAMLRRVRSGALLEVCDFVGHHRPLVFVEMPAAQVLGDDVGERTRMCLYPRWECSMRKRLASLRSSPIGRSTQRRFYTVLGKSRQAGDQLGG